MNKQDLNVAIELKRKLIQITPLLDYKVFGSRARGDSDPFSDLDVLLEIPHISDKIKNRILDVVWKVGFEYHIVIVPLIFTKNEIEESPLKSSPIVRSIFKDGVNV
jgi:predicted nucleotidyltransferase